MLSRPALALATALALLGVASQPAQSAEWRLICELTGYSDNNVVIVGHRVNPGVKRAILDIIPESATHVIDGESSHIEGTDQFGSISREGRQWILKYETRNRQLGRSKITYSFNMATRRLNARAFVEPVSVQSWARIEGISGTCVMER